MRVRYSQHFLRSYDKAPLQVQRTFDKQLILLLQNLRHPSLRAKKYEEVQGIWQARAATGADA